MGSRVMLFGGQGGGYDDVDSARGFLWVKIFGGQMVISIIGRGLEKEAS